jgi:hypothetical protein
MRAQNGVDPREDVKAGENIFDINRFLLGLLAI